MSLKDRLDAKFDVQKRFGYVVNKWLVRSAFIVMILLFGLISVVDGWDVAFGGSWVECPADSVTLCLNPYFDASCLITGVDCQPSHLHAGEIIGVKPSLLARSFSFICVGLFAFALLLNHLIYNKNFRVKNYEKN